MTSIFIIVALLEVVLGVTAVACFGFEEKIDAWYNELLSKVAREVKRYRAHKLAKARMEVERMEAQLNRATAQSRRVA